MTKVRISDDALAVACGADAVADAFKAVGCTVDRVSSWGMHWLEPFAEIGGLGFGPLEPSDVMSILDGTSAKAIGPIEEHPFLARQERFLFCRAGETRPLDLGDYAATGGWTGLAKARSISAEAIIADIAASGLRGRGGAGFPAAVKWETVRSSASPIKYVVCNADEGDSGTFADRMLMEGDPFMLIEGVAISALAVGAAKAYIYIRSEYPHAIQKMQAAVEAARDIVAPLDIEVRVGAGAYICGEETALLNSLEGTRGEVRAKPPLPALQGLFGQPTLVNNVLTLAAVPWILANGSAAYAEIGFGRSRGTMPIQISGNVKHGGLFEIGFGVTLGELVNDIAGGTASGRPVRAVQVGGPLGAFHPPSDFHLKFDYEQFAEAGGLIGHGGITVFDDTADMSAQARFAMQFCAAESCGKCTPCRIGSTRGVELIDRMRTGRRQPDRVASLPQMRNALNSVRSAAEDIQLLEDLCETMKFGSLCALGGFTPYPVLSALRHWPEDFAS